MKKLYISLTSIFLFFGLLLVINEIGTRYDTNIKIHITTYLLISFVVIAIILIPYLRRMRIFPLVLSISAIYILLRVVDYGITEKAIISQYIIEYAALVLAIVITKELNISIEEIDTALQAFSFHKARHVVHDLRLSSDIIEQEFSRSRRYGFPISLLLLNLRAMPLIPQDPKTPTEPQNRHNHALTHKQLSYKVIKILDSLVREFDMIIKIEDQEEILVICPETSKVQAALLEKRILDLLLSTLNLQLPITITTSPDDGRTFRAILSLAENQEVDPK